MCGISGIINFDNKPVLETDIRKMMHFQKHRGPDDEGILVDKNVGMGFVRLSILDLTYAGHQPMYSDDKRFSIIFNGEVYNYLELREELIQKGYSFKSDTDTEVVLKSYIEWGCESLNKFIGMWAFAIYDKIDRTVFLSRDRFGIKPLYYFNDNHKFIFSSEILPLLEIMRDLREVDDKIIYDFLLTNRTNHSENTFFKRIKKLQHAHSIRIDINQGTTSFQRWYSLENSNQSGYTSSEEFKEDLISSIKLQLRSDVPIGLCLSGGLDSSSIGSLISNNLGRKDIHSFSAIYGSGLKGDESEFIKEFDGIIDNIHFTKPNIDTFIDEMDDFIETIQEPVPGTSEYAEYRVMQLAKKYCTVILNGQGVDEYLAGYHYFSGFLLKEYIRNIRLKDFIRESFQYYSKHKSLFHLKSFVYFSLPLFLKRNLLIKQNKTLSKVFINSFRHLNKDSEIDRLYASNSLRESFLNHFEHKFEHHLLWADKSGMKFSLETRFPFLDHNIVAKAINTDNKLIYKNGITKVIMRDAMKGILPEKIRMRMDKVGYSTPESVWFAQPKFKELFFDTVNSQSFLGNKYFDRKSTLDFYGNFLRGRHNNVSEIWKIINLELWLNKFIN